jgi:hypothetical protein
MVTMSTPKPENTGTTLRGYSPAAKLDEDRESVVERAAVPADSPSIERRYATERYRSRARQPRPLWTGGPGLRPSTVTARSALGDLMNSCSKVDQQLALVEMLFAVGPEIRDRNALEDALQGLETIEDELDVDLAKLLSACGEVRGDGTDSGPHRR